MFKDICSTLIKNTFKKDEVTPEKILFIVNTIYKQYFKELKDSPVKEKYDFNKLLENQTNKSNEVTTTTTISTDEDVWIFGYGSLVWKADFPYINRRRGFIKGFQRHFYQQSIDHRGVPDKPGRVVTLVPTQNSDDRVYGMAYRIAYNDIKNVVEHLDYREKNGYERCALEFFEFPESSNVSLKVIMYIATAENKSYAGHIWQLPLIADQIFTSCGPSGPNREYLFHLANAMRFLFPGVQDKHLFDLEDELLERIKDIEPVILERFLLREIEKILSENIQCHTSDEEEIDLTVEKTAKELETLKHKCEEIGWRESVLAKEYFNCGCTK